MLTNASYRTRAILICAIAATFYCYEYYLRVAPSIISQELMFTFNISNAGLGLLSAFFYYAYMPAQIPVGILIDKYGPRIVLSIACSLCVIGTYIFATTDVLWIAYTGRFILGSGSAFAFIGVLKICNNWLPHKYYSLMVGVCMLLGMFGAMGGEIFLARMVDETAWQTVLQASACVGVIITILLWLIVRDSPAKAERPKPLKPPRHIKLISGLSPALKNKQFWLIGIIGCFTFLPLSSFAEMWAVPYLETVGYERSDAAYGSALVFLGFGIGGPIWGMSSIWFASRRIPLILGSLVSAMCAAIIILQPYMSSNYMYALLFFLGLFASAQILVFAIANDVTNKDSSGTSAALINMFVMLGGIILQPLIGMILDVISSNTVSEYQTALLVLPIGLFTASGLSFTLMETYKD